MDTERQPQLTLGETALAQCKTCALSQQSFLLQGGAGSGKTELLKELLLFLSKATPESRVICITHTNAAVNEIRSRTGDVYPVLTIHAFLHELIKDYKKNIHTVIPELFYIPSVEQIPKAGNISEANYKKSEYENYQKIFEQYAKRLYAVDRTTVEKVMGKREYDKAPAAYRDALNQRIGELNQRIAVAVSEKDYHIIKYSNTKFDSLSNLTYGHDGLLRLFHLLIIKYPLLAKIISDRFDYIFIDEYQDTDRNVIQHLIDISRKSQLTLGLFGDSMQSIYHEGIRNVDTYIQENVFVPIPKPDNYRCAYEIIDTLNPLRADGLTQKVALKKDEKGELEAEETRHGIVKVFYSVTAKKPGAFSSAEEKTVHQRRVDRLIQAAKELSPDAKVLMLTNKAIAEKNGFQNLYRVFDNRYTADVNEHIETFLTEIQALTLASLCIAYENQDYNALIEAVKTGGYVIRTLEDKMCLHNVINALITDTSLSVLQALRLAEANRIIRISENSHAVFGRMRDIITRLDWDEKFQLFKRLYAEGNNTYNRMCKRLEQDNLPIHINSTEVFEDLERELKQESFAHAVSSNEFKFSEVLKYGKYLNEETEYITMHKTKGTSIDSVVVVMEEFYWSQYKFSSIYSSQCDPKAERASNSRKLIYVACSRARKFLAIVRILEITEVEDFLKYFPTAEEFPIEE